MSACVSHPDSVGASEASVKLREDLYALLDEYKPRLEQTLDDDTALITSGVLDSLALFHLILWIEKQTKQSVDPTSIDLARECDTVRLILKFIEGFAPQVKRDDESGSSPRAHRRPGELRIVEYSPQYKEAVASLQTQLWSPDADLNREYLEWKYERNPYGNTPVIYLALHGEEVVAMRGFHPSYWEFGPQPRRRVLFVADDLVVRDDHRGRGLVNHLMRAAYAGLHRRGVDYLVNLSGGAFTVRSSIATGWKSAGDMDPIERCSRASGWRRRLRRVFSRSPLLWRYASSPFTYSGAERSPFERIDALSTVLVSKDGVGLSISRRAMPEGMASLVRRVRRDNRIRHVRDETYFAWRFKNPLHDYRFCYVGEEELSGYLVLKRKIDDRETSPRVSVVDLEAVDERTRDALLEVVTRRDLFEELYLWSNTVPGKSRGALSRAGFTALDQTSSVRATPRILVRPTDSARLTEDWCIDGIRILERDNWDMRMIYSMVA